MKETEDTRNMFETDPFEAFEKIKSQIRRFQSMIQVASCSRVRTRQYVSNDAVVTIGNGNDLQLTFRYEQKPRQGTKGTHIWYSIEMAQNSYSERKNLLVVQVWSPGDAPCTDNPAVCINDKMMEGELEENEDDLWSDIDEDEEADSEANGKTTEQDTSSSNPINDPNPTKRAKLSENPGAASQSQGNNEDKEEAEEEEENCDSYMAFMDPELLHSFLAVTKLGPMDEDAAFFLLMTFPFYEHEWDLVGFVLSEVFGSEADEEDS